MQETIEIQWKKLTNKSNSSILEFYISYHPHMVGSHFNRTETETIPKEINLIFENILKDFFSFKKSLYKS